MVGMMIMMMVLNANASHLLQNFAQATSSCCSSCCCCYCCCCLKINQALSTCIVVVVNFQKFSFCCHRKSFESCSMLLIIDSFILAKTSTSVT